MENIPGEKFNDPEKPEISDIKVENVFKKPVLIGKLGKLPKKLISKLNERSDNNEHNITDTEEVKKNVLEEGSIQAPVKQLAENSFPLSYKEPTWSGLPQSNGKDYVFEVLKNGTIIETINLMSKPFWVFGRLASCNVCMQHPTISRYHAVLQYRQEASDTDGPGFYIYDLGSTHGTFLNKNRLKSKVFVRMQVGHMLKLGCSSRSYILNGPECDEEEESEFSVTELKQKREEELMKQEEEKLRIQKELEEKKKKEDERGVDWGLGEDADEETDLSENPYAQTNNEELYLDDPKKALRGFFEREGLDLEYDCNEQGIGQFLCKVKLPVDDEMGTPIVAEVLHKGKKKEAVIQCALEACRILDRHGVLRQATHESRKRKAKNWEENDYYDSDEDTYLDRTGTIEKKREKRMHAKAPQKVETYQSLTEKEKYISKKISEIENELMFLQNNSISTDNENNEEDSLDTYMKGLSNVKTDKKSVSNLKMEITQLRGEHARIIRLINIVKPANLPVLVSQQDTSPPSTSKESNHKSLPLFGKRKKILVKFENKFKYDPASNNDLDEENDEEEEMSEKVKIDKTFDNENQSKEGNKKENISKEDNNKTDTVSDSHKPEDNNLPCTSGDTQDQDNYSSSSSSSSIVSDEEVVTVRSFTSLKSLHNTMTFKKFENILKKGLPPYAGKHQEKLEKILNNLKKLATNEDRMHVDWKILSAKKKKVMKLISDMRHLEPDEKLEHRVSSELNRILLELNSMTEQKYKVLDKVKKMGNEIQNISEAIEKDFKEYKKEVEQKHPNKQSDDEELAATGEEIHKSSDRSVGLSEKEESIDDNMKANTSDDRKRKKSKKDSPETRESGARATKGL